MQSDNLHSSPARSAGSRPWGIAILGFGLLVFGLLVTLENLDVLDAGSYLQYWPALLILLGLSHIAQPRASRRTGAGIAWIIAGSLILLAKLDLLRVDIWDLWPLILAAIGLSMLWRVLNHHRATPRDDADYFHAISILGGIERRVTAKSFRGGYATAFMGACVIDLRDSASDGEPAIIDTFAFWGGVEIRVPQDWEVQVKGTAILGGMEDKSATVNGSNKVLIVRGLAIMGGVEIKN